MRLRVTLPHRSRPDGGHFPCPDGTHSPAWQAPRQTAQALKMPSRPRDSCDNCTEIKCGKQSRVSIVRPRGVHLLEGEGVWKSGAISIGTKGMGAGITCRMAGGSRLLWGKEICKEGSQVTSGEIG